MFILNTDSAKLKYIDRLYKIYGNTIALLQNIGGVCTILVTSD